MTVDWEFFDRMTPDDAIAVLDALEAGEEVRSTRGPVVRGFKAASRTISGIDDDGLTAEGGAADELMVADHHDRRRRARHPGRGRGALSMTLTPVLTAHWDEADSYTIEALPPPRRLRAGGPGLRDGPGRAHRSWSRTPACAVAAARASPPA